MKTKKEILDYLARWCRFVELQDIPKTKKKFLKAHPFLAPKGWEEELKKHGSQET
jgi:hypothetical protein